MLSTYYMGTSLDPDHRQELLSLLLASVTSVTPNYMPSKDRWKDSGSEIATAAKISPVDPSYVGKRAF